MRHERLAGHNPKHRHQRARRARCRGHSGRCLTTTSAVCLGIVSDELGVKALQPSINPRRGRAKSKYKPRAERIEKLKRLLRQYLKRFSRINNYQTFDSADRTRKKPNMLRRRSAPMQIYGYPAESYLLPFAKLRDSILQLSDAACRTQRRPDAKRCFSRRSPARPLTGRSFKN